MAPQQRHRKRHACTLAYEAFSRERVHGPPANIADLALRRDREVHVFRSPQTLIRVRPRLDRLRDCLLVFFVGVVLFRVAAAMYFLTDLLVAAAPVVMLASFVAVSGMASNASRRVVGQWGGAGGAVCEDHFCPAAGR